MEHHNDCAKLHLFHGPLQALAAPHRLLFDANRVAELHLSVLDTEPRLAVVEVGLVMVEQVRSGGLAALRTALWTALCRRGEFCAVFGELLVG